MRISYTYSNYPNCPRATEYSKSAEESAVRLYGLIGLITIGAIITFLICTFSFFGEYQWGDFLGGISFVAVAALLDFYAIVIRPQKTNCEIKVILAEEGNRHLPQYVVQQFCDNLRKETKKENTKAFLKYLPVFLAALSDAIALIGSIKGVYFLCHKEYQLPLLLCSLAALGVFSFIIWRLLNAPALDYVSSNESTSNASFSSSTQTENTDIAFCRKCGTKVLSDSVFCSKCGAKVR